MIVAITIGVLVATIGVSAGTLFDVARRRRNRSGSGEARQQHDARVEVWHDGTDYRPWWKWEAYVGDVKVAGSTSMLPTTARFWGRWEVKKYMWRQRHPHRIPREGKQVRRFKA